MLTYAYTSLVLEQASWMQVVHEVLLPVLDDVRDCASLNRYTLTYADVC
jgi:hypothetical protein